MNIVKKISLLNQTTLASLNESDGAKVIERFTKVGLKIFSGNFGFMFWKKEKSDPYTLAYKSPNTPFEPNIPRRKGYNARVEKSKRPYLGPVQRERITKYDLTRYIKSIVIIPIYYKNHTYGNLVLCFKKKHNFSSEEKNLATALGNTTAQAITTGRLYRNLEDVKQNLEDRVKSRTNQLLKANSLLKQEIAQRRQIQGQLEESKALTERDKAKNEALLESIGEGILATDARGKIILVNPQAEFILGKKESDLVGQKLNMAQPLLDEHGKEIDVAQQPSFKALTNRKFVQSARTRTIFYKKKNGNLTPISFTATPVILRKKIIGVIQVFRDITKEAEIDRVKSELISLASHQLRTPLSAINWYAEALMKEEIGKVSKGQKKYLEQIYHANQRMVELVYDFLNVSRLELGTFSMQPSTINLLEVAQDVLREITPIIKQKKITVVHKYGKKNSSVLGDKKIIRLILQNLVTNAVKYTQNKGTITIRINVTKSLSSKDTLSIVVSDNGYGIPKEQQAKIFTKLFRADNAAKLDTKGSGLGLYLVKSFVEFCKGKIWFTSKENKGSVFHVLLPVSLPVIKSHRQK